MPKTPSTKSPSRVSRSARPVERPAPQDAPTGTPAASPVNPATGVPTWGNTSAWTFSSGNTTLRLEVVTVGTTSYGCITATHIGFAGEESFAEHCQVSLEELRAGAYPMEVMYMRAIPILLRLLDERVIPAPRPRSWKPGDL